MKEVTIRIPEKKFEFFMKLMEELGFKTQEGSILISDDENDISENHKSIVRNRISKSKENPERLLDWNKAQNDLKLD